MPNSFIIKKMAEAEFINSVLVTTLVKLENGFEFFKQEKGTTTCPVILNRLVLLSLVTKLFDS